MRSFKYNPAALKNALLPSPSEGDQPVPRSKKRRRLNFNGSSTDPSASEGGLEYGVVLETSKERFLVIRHCGNVQSEATDGVKGIIPDKSTFTISLIQGEVEAMGDSPAPTSTTTLKLDNLTSTPTEEPKSPFPAPEQPTKEPSPVEPLPPVSTPQEAKEVIPDPERGRSTSVVDMELDTPASVTPTATANPEIPIPISGRTLPTEGESKLDQDPVPQDPKPTVDGDRPQPGEDALLTENASVKPEAAPSKPSPSPVVGSESARPDALPLTAVPAPVPQAEAQGLLQVKFKLQILQRSIREEDLVFGDDGLGILSADVDPLDNAKKGWLIETPRWRRYNGGTSDSIVVG